MQLVIAEKPSVGMALAKVLEVTGRKEGYMEGGRYLVSWCIGHLVEPVPADTYNPKYSRWDYSDLPIFPDPWQYQALPGTKKQFQILSALMADSRVDTVVCATDAGREGELIFRLVYMLAGCQKPVKRLWISSLEESAIRKGFEQLADGSRYERLYQAALCRQKADWLVGVNGTRLLTTLYKGKTLPVGRVMTPTLALIAGRETAIQNFKKEKFYTVELDLQAAHAAGARFPSKTEAKKLVTACLGKIAIVRSVTQKEKAESPPKLYDLTTLQREANRLYGYTAQQTLDYLQSLYEQKLATYPRTDSRYLTGEMAEGLPALCQSLAEALPFMQGQELPVHAGQVVDDSQVSDHHAVIPTMQAAAADLSSLPTGERHILLLLIIRLLCAVGEPYRYMQTAVTLECGGVSFSAKGNAVAAMGWKGIEEAFFMSLKKRPKRENPSALPPLYEGQEIPAEAVLKEGTTSPPERFTEDTLLRAMECADAEDMPDSAEHKGLGTPATRAATIEKLVRTGFVVREKGRLLPTGKGLELARVAPDLLCSAKLTAEWEEKLAAVERGELAAGDFMAGIHEMLAGLVAGYKPAASAALSRSGREKVGVCPRCGKDVVGGKKSFFCEGYYDSPSCGFALWKNDRFFVSKRKTLDRKTAAVLLRDGRVRLTGLFSEKKGVIYDAVVLLDDSGSGFVRFKLEFDNKKER